MKNLTLLIPLVFLAAIALSGYLAAGTDSMPATAPNATTASADTGNSAATAEPPQPAPEAEGPEPTFVRSYEVADLLAAQDAPLTDPENEATIQIPGCDHPLFPTSDYTEPRRSNLFGYHPSPPPPPPTPIDLLARTIKDTVARDTWKPEGTVGVINSRGTLLVIGQTSKVHKAIEQLLADMRKARLRRTVCVDAQWVVLDEAQLKSLGIDKLGGAARAVDLSQLKDPPQVISGGSVSCFDNQLGAA